MTLPISCVDYCPIGRADLLRAGTCKTECTAPQMLEEVRKYLDSRMKNG